MTTSGSPGPPAVTVHMDSPCTAVEGSVSSYWSATSFVAHISANPSGASPRKRNPSMTDASAMRFTACRLHIIDMRDSRRTMGGGMLMPRSRADTLTLPS